jgi:hypothetical protein
MTVQKKLPYIFEQSDPEWWKDIQVTISRIVRDLLFGRHVARIAGQLGKTDSLLYKWAHEDEPQLPNAEQLFTLTVLTEDCSWVVRMAKACGYDVVPRDLGDLEAVEYFLKERMARR